MVRGTQIPEDVLKKVNALPRDKVGPVHLAKLKSVLVKPGLEHVSQTVVDHHVSAVFLDELKKFDSARLSVKKDLIFFLAHHDLVDFSLKPAELAEKLGVRLSSVGIKRWNVRAYLKRKIASRLNQ